MKLNYINIGLDYELYSKLDNEFRYSFQKQMNFICDYFSKAIRKYKFKTDGTFNMISINCTEFEMKSTSVVPIDVLDVYVKFNKNLYEKLKHDNDYSYCIELLEQGFRKAAELKLIPLEILLNIIEEFKLGGYKNEWMYKRRRFNEDDLEIVLTCNFTANYFQLTATINQLSTKLELVKGVIMKSESGVSIHEGMYKDILIEKDIVITDTSDSPRIIINKASVFKGILKFKIKGDIEIRQLLSFEL